MERFHHGLPADPQYAVYKSDPAWRRLYAFLRCGYWHVTNPAKWEAIKESGAIKPNVDEGFEMRFESQTKKSIGHVNGYVMLFDFVTPSEEEIIGTWEHAWDVLTDEVTTVLLRLDRRRLRTKVIPNSAANCGDGYISFCEVWYPEPIPMIAISSVYRVPSPAAFGEFRPEQIGKTERVEQTQRPPAVDPLAWLPEKNRRELF